MEQVGNESFEAENLKCELKNSKFILNFCSVLIKTIDISSKYCDNVYNSDWM